MTLADEKYVAFTTFKKDGTPKPLPVWPVDVGEGRVGFITSSHAWKAKVADKYGFQLKLINLIHSLPLRRTVRLCQRVAPAGE